MVVKGNPAGTGLWVQAIREEDTKKALSRNFHMRSKEEKLPAIGPL